MIAFAISTSCSNQSENISFPITVQINSGEGEDASGLMEKFELKEIIVLDTSKGAILNTSNLTNIYFADDKILLNEMYNPKIPVFNRNTGEVINVINRSGRGPQEYTPRKSNFAVVGNNIVVPGFDETLKYYDFYGKYIESRGKLGGHRNFINTPNGNFIIDKDILYIGRHKHYNPEKPYYSAELISEDGEILKGSVERDLNTFPVGIVVSGSTTLFTDGEEIWLSQFSDNTISKFNYSDSTFKPLFSLKLDNYTAMAQALTQISQNGGAIQIDSYYTIVKGVTEDYILVIFDGQEKLREVVLLEKSGSNYTHYKYDKECDLMLGSLIGSNNGTLVQVLDYADLTKEGAENSELVKRIKGLTTIDEYMNCVLCIYEQK